MNSVLQFHVCEIPKTVFLAHEYNFLHLPNDNCVLKVKINFYMCYWIHEPSKKKVKLSLL
jgi:hypothetical protein